MAKTKKTYEEMTLDEFIGSAPSCEADFDCMEDKGHVRYRVRVECDFHEEGQDGCCNARQYRAAMKWLEATKAIGGF